MKPPILALAIATLLAGAVPAFAQPYLEFDDASIFGGSLAYNGADGVGALIGTDIVFDLVTGIGSPITGPLEIVNGRLNFETGPNISETPTLYRFAPGGTFTLSGTVIKPDLSIVASGVLVLGTFLDDSFVAGLGAGYGLFTGIGIDRKNRDLLDYYQIEEQLFQFANTEIGLAVAGLDPAGGFIANVLDADLINGIPETGTVSAVIGLGGLVFWCLVRWKLR